MLALLSRLTGIIMYRLWEVLDYQRSPWPLVLLLCGLALVCWLFRKASQARRENRGVGREYRRMGWIGLVLLILSTPLVSLMFLSEPTPISFQSASLQNHYYYLAGMIYLSPDGDRVTLLLEECDGAGVFCHEVALPVNGFEYVDGASEGRFILQVDTRKQTLMVVADGRRILTYKPGAH